MLSNQVTRRHSETSSYFLVETFALRSHTNKRAKLSSDQENLLQDTITIT